MSIEKQLFEDMKVAIKGGRKVELDTIRMVRSQLKSAAIDKKDDLSEEEVVQVLHKEAKKRKEAIEMYQKGNREDLVEKETAELDIISTYLPEQLSSEELNQIIKETCDSLQVSSDKDLGRVMGAIMPKVKGKADGKSVQQKVKEYFANL
jgi:uncharacterized protein YqeY